MKKIVAALMICSLGVTAFAQEVVVKKEDKVKKTTTIGQNP